MEKKEVMVNEHENIKVEIPSFILDLKLPYGKDFIMSYILVEYIKGLGFYDVSVEYIAKEIIYNSFHFKNKNETDVYYLIKDTFKLLNNLSAGFYNKELK